VFLRKDGTRFYSEGASAIHRKNVSSCPDKNALRLLRASTRGRATALSLIAPAPRQREGIGLSSDSYSSVQSQRHFHLRSEGKGFCSSSSYNTSNICDYFTSSKPGMLAQSFFRKTIRNDH
jgi:hypothetical protein